MILQTLHTCRYDVLFGDGSIDRDGKRRGCDAVICVSVCSVELSRCLRCMCVSISNSSAVSISHSAQPTIIACHQPLIRYHASLSTLHLHASWLSVTPAVFAAVLSTLQHHPRTELQRHNLTVQSLPSPLCCLVIHLPFA